MDRALIKFNNFLDVANAYKTNNQLYMFLRDCAFRGIYESISSNICADEMVNSKMKFHNTNGTSSTCKKKTIINF